jgi:hypothetical protein
MTTTKGSLMREPTSPGACDAPSKKWIKPFGLFAEWGTSRAVCAAAALALSSAVYAAPHMGAYQWDAPTGPGNLDGFSQWLERPITHAKAFGARGSWSDITGPAWQLGAWSQWVKAQPGRNFIYSVPMLPGDRNLAGPDGVVGTADDLSLAKCAAGQYDTHWARLADNLVYYGLHSAYLRPGWEMDGSWFAWRAEPGSGREAHFAGCFRRIVQTMRQRQPTAQWRFVLNTATAWSNRSYLEAIWPGDQYVDVVGIDFYDQSWYANTYPYPSGCDAACRLARQQTAWHYTSRHLFTLRDFALARGKSIAIPEWGVAIRPDGHGGGDNPYYMRKMHEFIHDPQNEVEFHAYWNVSAHDIDGRLTDSVRGDNPAGQTRFPESAMVFRELFGATQDQSPTPLPAPGPEPISSPPPVVDAAPPTVSITSPTDGTVISRRSRLNIEAAAASAIGVATVTFLVNNRPLCIVKAAPYACLWDTGNRFERSYTITVRVTDLAGNLASSSQTFLSRK